MENKKKLKICIHGIVGGRDGKDGLGGNLSVPRLYDHFKEKVIDPNSKNYNVEIFIHTWSCEETK